MHLFRVVKGPKEKSALICLRTRLDVGLLNQKHIKIKNFTGVPCRKAMNLVVKRYRIG